MPPKKKKPEKGKAILAENLEYDAVSVPEVDGWESELENEPGGQPDNDLIANNGENALEHDEETEDKVLPVDPTQNDVNEDGKVQDNVAQDHANQDEAVDNAAAAEDDSDLGDSEPATTSSTYKKSKKLATAGKKTAKASKTGGTSKKQEKGGKKVARANAKTPARITAGRPARQCIGTVMTGPEATNARCRNRTRNTNRRCHHHQPPNPQWGSITPT
ncbi:unnamed protein product [Sphagnum balticum]